MLSSCFSWTVKTLRLCCLFFRTRKSRTRKKKIAIKIRRENAREKGSEIEGEKGRRGTAKKNRKGGGIASEEKAKSGVTRTREGLNEARLRVNDLNQKEHGDHVHDHVRGIAEKMKKKENMKSEG